MKSAVLPLVIASTLVLGVGCDSEVRSPVEVRTADFDYTRRSACETAEHDPYTMPDKMSLERKKGIVVATIYYGLTCGYATSDPVVDYTPTKVSLQVSVVDVFPDGDVGCICADRLTFALKRDVPAGTPIIFSHDGVTTGQGVAP